METSTRVETAQTRSGSSVIHVSASGASYLPKPRRTFKHFSSTGIITEGGGLVSGALRIQLRKGFKSKTRVMVAYADHDVFVEVQGSPLAGDVRPHVILNLLRATGRVDGSLSSDK